MAPEASWIPVSWLSETMFPTTRASDEEPERSMPAAVVPAAVAWLWSLRFPLRTTSGELLMPMPCRPLSWVSLSRTVTLLEELTLIPVDTAAVTVREDSVTSALPDSTSTPLLPPWSAVRSDTSTLLEDVTRTPA